MDYKLLKNKAISLRKKGISYGEIKKIIKVSKSTLSYWLKDVPLTKEQKKRLYTNSIAILSKGPQSQKERRKREIQEIIKKSEQEIKKPISFETYRLFGVALYWAEGDKKNGLCVTNSDPSLILFMVKWFKDILGISPKNTKAYLNIYPQQNDLKIKKFWSQLTGIPLENFGKSYIKPLNKNYKKNNLYYGTIKIVPLKGTNYRYKIFGWIKAILRETNIEAEKIQHNWKKLTEVSRAINLP